MHQKHKAPFLHYPFMSMDLVTCNYSSTISLNSEKVRQETLIYFFSTTETFNCGCIFGLICMCTDSYHPNMLFPFSNLHLDLGQA